MSESWSDQDRRDLRRAQTDLEKCRRKILELTAAKDKALWALRAVARDGVNQHYQHVVRLIAELEGAK